MTLLDWIMARVVVNESGCWLWQGSLSKSGYASIWVAGKKQRAHRVLWELTNGPIADGLELDHVRERGCVHRHCINPAHLEPVTHHENLLRGSGFAATNAAKTHCIRGHPFDEPNTYYFDEGRQRHCRACDAIRAAHQRALRGPTAEQAYQREYRERNRDAINERQRARRRRAPAE